MYIGRLYADTIDAVINYTVFSDVDNIYNVIDQAPRKFVILISRLYENDTYAHTPLNRSICKRKYMNVSNHYYNLRSKLNGNN